MLKMKFALITFCSFVFLVGCPDALPADAGNSALDAGNSALDAGNSALDAGNSALDAENSALDAGNSALDAGNSALDAGNSALDAGNLSLDLGPVQCRSNEDCGGGSCRSEVPGGICDCAGTCPLNTACSAFGACARECLDDSECSLGKECKTSVGVCGLRTCSINESCPFPYICSNSRCERPLCDNGSCPGNMICASGQCMEPIQD